MATQHPVLRPIVSISEFARVIGKGRRWVKARIAEGVIKTLPVGPSPQIDLERELARLTGETVERLAKGRAGRHRHPHSP